MKLSAQVESGLEVLAKKDFRAAGRLFVGLYNERPNNQVVLYHLARSYFGLANSKNRSGEVDAARRLYEKAINVLENKLLGENPAHYSALFLLARVYDAIPDVSPQRVIAVLDRIPADAPNADAAELFRKDMMLQKNLKEYLAGLDGKRFSEGDFDAVFLMPQQVENVTYTSRYASLRKDLLALQAVYYKQMENKDGIDNYDFADNRLNMVARMIQESMKKIIERQREYLKNDRV